MAVRPISGARALDQGCAVVIAGLVATIGGRVLAAQGWVAEGCDVREGYAQGILSGRGIADDVGTIS